MTFARFLAVFAICVAAARCARHVGGGDRAGRAAAHRVQAGGRTRRRCRDPARLSRARRNARRRRRRSSTISAGRPTPSGSEPPATASASWCSPGRRSNSSASVRRATRTGTSACSSGRTRAAAASSRSRRSSPPRIRLRPSVDTLREKSVAVQGLFALEFVLYGTGSEVLTEPRQPGTVVPLPVRRGHRRRHREDRGGDPRRLDEAGRLRRADERCRPGQPRLSLAWRGGAGADQGGPRAASAFARPQARPCHRGLARTRRSRSARRSGGRT